jgi:hypothetical protein
MAQLAVLVPPVVVVVPAVVVELALVGDDAHPATKAAPRDQALRARGAGLTCG